MKRNVILLITLIATVLISTKPADAAQKGSKKLLGSYAINIDTPDGERDTELHITKEEGEYKVLLGEDDGSGQLKCTGIKVDGKKISFNFYIEGYDLTMDLEVKGDNISGLMQFEYSVTGERIKEKKK